MSSSAAAAPAPSKGLHYTLWGLQLLLGAMMTMAGLMKAVQPLDALAEGMPWVGQVPGWVTRTAGIADALGGIGLVLPAATRILPFLTPLAAIGLATVMVLAAVMHASLGDFGALPVNVVLFGLLAFVAWGRGVKAPIAPR